MPQTRISCPRCRQPVLAEITQLFDVNSDPEAKQKILSGSYNLIHCQNCSYEGNYSTPMVFHDPNKELLLTFFPPELGLPVIEQERLIGPLITQVVNRLPAEKRKAYLLRPQGMLTMQTMVERILESDGITREMVQAQQQRLALLQRLLTATSDDVRAEIVHQEEKLIDESFFEILNRIMEASLASGDQQSAQALGDLQQKLLPLTAVGQRLQVQAQEAEAAVKSLQEAQQKGLTRESLLELIVEAPSEARLTALVSLARSGMDYNFFEILSKRIDKANGDEKTHLTDLRDRLLKMTGEIDKAMQAHMDEAQALLKELLAAKDVREAIIQKLPEISDLFVELLRSELNDAHQKYEKERGEKLEQIYKVIQEASAPPEIALIQDLMRIPDDATLQKAIQEHHAEITDEFVQIVAGLISQIETQPQGQDPRVTARLKAVYSAALRQSMSANLSKT